MVLNEVISELSISLSPIGFSSFSLYITSRYKPSYVWLGFNVNSISPVGFKPFLSEISPYIFPEESIIEIFVKIVSSTPGVYPGIVISYLTMALLAAISKTSVETIVGGVAGSKVLIVGTFPSGFISSSFLLKK